MGFMRIVAEMRGFACFVWANVLIAWGMGAFSWVAKRCFLAVWKGSKCVLNDLVLLAPSSRNPCLRVWCVACRDMGKGSSWWRTDVGHLAHKPLRLARDIEKVVKKWLKFRSFSPVFPRNELTFEVMKVNVVAIFD